MLVLTRKELESIRIGDCTITILLASRGRVRIGIEAPRETVVVRKEIDKEEVA